jgi:hypothetical protein
VGFFCVLGVVLFVLLFFVFDWGCWLTSVCCGFGALLMLLKVTVDDCCGCVRV